MKIKPAIVLLISFIFLCNINIFSQTAPNFKPFTNNSQFAKSNEYLVKNLLDTTVKKFLLIANDTTSNVYKSVQSAFDDAKITDHLQSYIYPKTLRKNNITVQFVNWSQENGLLGEDSVWDSESLDAMIFIPVMFGDQHGETIMNLCFTAELNIYTESKTDIEGISKTTFNIKKVDFFEMLNKK
jgi:hypothetical protein